jgi:hypothetical protein
MDKIDKTDKAEEMEQKLTKDKRGMVNYFSIISNYYIKLKEI